MNKNRNPDKIKIFGFPVQRFDLGLIFSYTFSSKWSNTARVRNPTPAVHEHCFERPIYNSILSMIPITSSIKDVPRSSSRDQLSSIDVVSLKATGTRFCSFDSRTCPFEIAFSSFVIRRGFGGPLRWFSEIVPAGILLLFSVFFPFSFAPSCVGVVGPDAWSWLSIGNDTAVCKMGDSNSPYPFSIRLNPGRSSECSPSVTLKPNFEINKLKINFI